MAAQTQPQRGEPRLERLRRATPAWRHLRRVSLRTKLVASVLVLVFAALTLISSASTYALRNYQLQRLDESLTIYAQTLSETRWVVKPSIPGDYYVSQSTIDGVGDSKAGDGTLTPMDVPPLVTGLDKVYAVMDNPYTVRSPSGRVYWRVIVTVSRSGTVVQVGEKLSGIEKAITRLVWVDVLVGVGVLIALASIGAAIVRQSLIPLLQIERTAAAIAAGDLSQRVPDPEANEGDPTTELGRSRRLSPRVLSRRRRRVRRRRWHGMPPTRRRLRSRGRCGRRRRCASSWRMPRMSCAPR
jgi:two-component system OmpR family sensor kinase